MSSTGQKRAIYGEDDPGYLSRHVNWLVASTIIVFVAGVFTYGEKFSFWNYAYSYLGRLKTPGGNDNTWSFGIYVIGSIFNSFICFRISGMIRGRLNRILFLICGAGYILLALPCDVVNTLHTTGGVMVFGSLWFFATRRLNEIFVSGSRNRAILYHLILQGTVLPYAIMYGIHSPSMQAAQKFALVGLILVLKLIFINKYPGNSGTENAITGNSFLPKN